MLSSELKTHLRIGQRMIKTVISVFVCFVIDYFRTSGNPFHSAIAAIVSLQRNIEESWVTGRQRLIATIIGGVYGTALVALEQNVYLIEHMLLRYLMISLMLIPLIKLTVLLKQPKGTSLTCIVYLAITINSPTTAGMSVAMSYAMNRMLDTLIGVMVALVINMIPLAFWRKFSPEK